MANQVNYNPDEIETLKTESNKIATNVSEITTAIDRSYESLDSRIQREYADIFSNINSTNSTIKNESANVDQYGKWLTDTQERYLATNAQVNSIADNAGKGAGIDGSLASGAVGLGVAGAATSTGLDSGLKETIGGLGNANDLEYKFNPDAFESLPADVKDGIKTKLKELGFTDEEIKKILNGEVAVSKVALDTLSAELEKALKNDPTLRNKLLEIYGFDIFNEDGTINKDRLALAMIMDEKNKNDQYNLNAFIKKSTTDNKPKPTPQPTPPANNQETPDNIIGNTLPSGGNQNSNNLPGGISNIHGTDTLETDSAPDIISEEESLLNLTDTTDNLTTSVSHGQILPTSNTEVKKGGMGVAAVAGLGSAIAAAAGGATYIKKKKAKENEEDIEFISEEDQQVLKQGDSDEDDDNDENKDWLYGLGLGLTGAGGLALMDDDDDDDDDEDDTDFYPSF